jgi:hypothetical protein
MKLLIMQFSPTSCHFIPLRPKYARQQLERHKNGNTMLKLLNDSELRHCIHGTELENLIVAHIVKIFFSL